MNVRGEENSKIIKIIIFVGRKGEKKERREEKKKERKKENKSKTSMIHF